MKRAWIVAGAAVGCALLTASALSYLYFNPLTL